MVDRIHPLLHIDPVVKLPPELTFQIFSYLDAKTLLTASLASRSWRTRILDSGLWKALYIQEGWKVDLHAIQLFEQEHAEAMSPPTRRSRPLFAEPDIGEPRHKKRVPPTWLQSRGANELAAAGPSGQARTDADEEGDHHMADATDRAVSDSTARATSSRVIPFSSLLQPPLKSSLLIHSPNGSAKVNWVHLYKQRRRLEANWHHGRYKNFQFPHPAYPEEGHTECVYAIQFQGKWLASSSRDRSVRVWDLETKRLWHPPLLGHDKSVLCLQFDPSPEEDIIISGSSDRSVIMWRFSTGEQIHRIPEAHTDSVLNLKFDRRFLATCSKDRTVKVWNRRELLPFDDDYPRVVKGSGAKYPSYIIDLHETKPSLLEASLANGQIKALQPYSLLMTATGHGAAINSMQLHGDDIVTASGDRLIKVWNIRNGACLKTLIGHDKGIACVQFDSRRIVSGSNDNTIRIFDHASGAEVACLRGHNNLVRTVQAGFGDPPGAEEALRLKAKEIENEYFKAQEAGTRVSLGLRASQRGSRRRAAGAPNPFDLSAFGAKIPPGGGGGPWARIVSGSYDESVLIWRKDSDGAWTIGYRLLQADAVANAACGNLSEAARAAIATQAQHLQAVQGQLARNSDSSTDADTGNDSSSANDAAGPAQPNGAANQPAVPAQPHHPHAPQRRRRDPPSSRVFKLQFDSRKIVCASVDPRIVGWDFACDDPDILETCPFFQGL